MSVENAIAAMYRLMQRSGLYYVVEFDIKGFFDNVDHTKLIRQLWSLNIRDKKLLHVIRRILKAPIQMPDGHLENPKKGTPQGGIISPLLANVVLNELDHWVESQWQNFLYVIATTGFWPVDLDPIDKGYSNAFFKILANNSYSNSSLLSSYIERFSQSITLASKDLFMKDDADKAKYARQFSLPFGDDGSVDSLRMYQEHKDSIHGQYVRSYWKRGYYSDLSIFEDVRKDRREGVVISNSETKSAYFLGVSLNRLMIL